MRRDSNHWNRVLALSAAVGALLFPSAVAQEAYVRVVDVGAGLCVIARTPAGATMVYDTGPPGTRCSNAVAETVRHRPIHLLVLSHSDADHIGGATNILAAHEVLQILHPGDDRPLRTSGRKNTLGKTRDAIAAEESASIYNLAVTYIGFGDVMRVGAAEVTFVAGWSDGHESEGPGEPALSGGPLHNGLSIVVHFKYGAHSILLTGDTVGRKANESSADDDSACRYAEARMVENADYVPIAADVLIGQHHGAENSSSNCFIEAVDPSFVVFSAGSNATYKHPRKTAAERYLASGIPKENIFRTDRGDKEGGTEWGHLAMAGCNDPSGDDDVVIWLPKSASEPVRVHYINHSPRCDASGD